jgi:hypothetical protein
MIKFSIGCLKSCQLRLPKSPITAKDNSVSSPTAGRVLNAKMPSRAAEGGEGSMDKTNQEV